MDINFYDQVYQLLDQLGLTSGSFGIFLAEWFSYLLAYCILIIPFVVIYAIIRLCIRGI